MILRNRNFYTHFLLNAIENNSQYQILVKTKINHCIMVVGREPEVDAKIHQLYNILGYVQDLGDNSFI